MRRPVAMAFGVIAVASWACGGGSVAPATDHGPPTIALSSASVETDPGLPVALDARGSSDPDGRALSFAWTIASQPASAVPALSGTNTATPIFASTTLGTYVLSLVLTALDGQSTAATVTILVRLPTTMSYVYLESDAGDYIGWGRAYFYTLADSVLTLTATGGHLVVSLRGDTWWNADFVEPSALSELTPGRYDGLKEYPSSDPAVGGLDWTGDGRGCDTITGWFAIDSVGYSETSLSSIDLRFEQHCEGGSPALHGQIHWYAADPTTPPGPVDPPPSDLWRPSPGATPASGSFVYLEGDPGDYILDGATHLYTLVDALIQPSSTGGHLEMAITGDQDWRGDFQAMYTLAQLEAGYYGDVHRYPFNNPTAGGLDWSGEGRGCNTLEGWFVVDGITYSGVEVTSVDLRFEQHCEDAGPALHGQIHWYADDPTTPPGPVSPPPAGLWQPDPSVTPAIGSYVYLESDPGDWVGAGATYLHTLADALIQPSSSGRLLEIGITGDLSWTGDFQAMDTLAQLEPGYYGNLQRYPFNNPTIGGLDWSGDGRGCNWLTGWFVVDAITYSAAQVTAVDLRFEQHCEGAAQALHGKIHWYAGDPTTPPGPVNPPPIGLWQPDPGAIPATGSYVYLQSDAGDYVGDGATSLYTPQDATLAVASGPGAYARVTVSGVSAWSGDFEGMSSLTALQPGYYGDLERYPFHNPVRGGFDWFSDSRGCNTVTGWFVVDAISYSGTGIDALDLRFEQHCQGAIPALHGQIHWSLGG